MEGTNGTPQKNMVYLKECRGSFKPVVKNQVLIPSNLTNNHKTNKLGNVLFMDTVLNFEPRFGEAYVPQNMSK